MEDRNFAVLKERYHLNFSADTKESRILEAMRKAERLHLKAPVRNRITGLLSEYGQFHFTKTERISGDEITFEFRPLLLPVHPDSNEKAAFISGYRNCSCSLYVHESTRYIECFYVDAAGFIRNQEQRLIAENMTDFWEYIMEKEYDYHPEISGDVMQLLRGAGWYEGRKIRIDALLEECMEDDVFPSDTQIAFIQEFGGLYGIQLNDEAKFWFSDRRVNRTFANLAKKQVRTEERWALHYHGADTLCVGCCNDGMDPVYLTPEGQLLTRSRKVGRTIWEGVQCILGY